MCKMVEWLGNLVASELNDMFWRITSHTKKVAVMENEVKNWNDSQMIEFEFFFQLFHQQVKRPSNNNKEQHGIIVNSLIF